jgi:hypothetical protein
MITATWTDTVVAVSTVAGTIAIFGALIFAALQTRALQHQLTLSNKENERASSLEQASLDIQLMERIIEVDHVFIEHPEMREYFFEGTETPATNPKRAKVLAVADLIMDVADSVASARRHGHMLDEDYEAWKSALRSYFADSPAMQDLWPKTGPHYGPGTADVLFDAAAPPSDEFGVNRTGEQQALGK